MAVQFWVYTRNVSSCNFGFSIQPSCLQVCQIAVGALAHQLCHSISITFYIVMSLIDKKSISYAVADAWCVYTLQTVSPPRKLICLPKSPHQFSNMAPDIASSAQSKLGNPGSKILNQSCQRPWMEPDQKQTGKTGYKDSWACLYDEPAVFSVVWLSVHKYETM